MEKKRITIDRNVRQPEPISVSMSQGLHIRIAQKDEEFNFSRDGEVVIVVHMDDVDDVIKWMQEVKAEIEEEREYERLNPTPSVDEE